MRNDIQAIVFVPSYFGDVGGSVNERQLTQAMSGYCSSVWVFSLIGMKDFFAFIKRKGMKAPSKMVIIPIPIPWFLAPGLSLYIALLVYAVRRVKKFDMIYVRSPWLSLGFLVPNTLRRITLVKIPAIAEDEIRNRDGLLFRLLRWLYTSVNTTLDKLALIRSELIGVPSQILGETIIRKRSVSPVNPLVAIPAGIDRHLIAEIGHRSARAPGCLSKETKVIGYLGGMSWSQGVDILCQAMAIVKLHRPNSVLHLVGDGPQRKEFEGLCRSLGVKFTSTGMLPHKDALRMLSQFDVLALPRRSSSTTESVFPIKVLEALGLGVPVIVTPHRVLIESFKDREEVLYAKPTPEGFANGIELLLSDSKLRNRLKTRGPGIAGRFSYEEIAKQLIDSVTTRSSSVRDNIHTR
jgi:glycosyltransferase involved in cell wall biosynthesis